MEEDGGQSLFSFVAKAHQIIESGRITINEWHKMVQVIFKQMLIAIEYLHNKRICHYDISLENFVLNDINMVQSSCDKQLRFVLNDAEIKLCDFGLAEIFSVNSNFQSTKWCGKVSYQSPEMAAKDDKKPFDARKNDIWCLGVSLFTMLIGGAPFKIANTKDLAFKCIISGNVVKLLSDWNRLKYVNANIIDLFNMIFQAEHSRCDLKTIKQCKWLNEAI